MEVPRALPVGLHQAGCLGSLCMGNPQDHKTIPVLFGPFFVAGEQAEVSAIRFSPAPLLDLGGSVREYCFLPVTVVLQFFRRYNMSCRGTNGEEV
jgi:hypothetical protein